ncbi:immunoglobulin-like domain-containing protein, partial [Acinetobacter junii]|uniref:immunoglobulin-like domain-containing protein n=1 Tax=Acinetobacter junii TaxID=40215 RepID=UPI000558EB32
GQIITIAVGQTTGQVTFANPNGEDVYVDGETLVIGVTSAVGGNYENLVSPADVSVVVNDTIDNSTLTLTAAAVNEGADITISATVDNAPEDTDLVITLDNGQIITIAVGQTTGQVTF